MPTCIPYSDHDNARFRSFSVKDKKLNDANDNMRIKLHIENCTLHTIHVQVTNNLRRTNTTTWNICIELSLRYSLRLMDGKYFILPDQRF